MLVHICCSVDSHYFLQQLQKDLPNEKLIGFFYNPNIHPYSEYRLRLLDVQRSCDMLKIELIEGKYNLDGWFNATKGLENEPEKGSRCSVCFEHRFEISAKKAYDLGEQSFTSTLLTSPKKSIEQLKTNGDLEAKKYNIKFYTKDYRKNNGTNIQMKLAKDDMLYHQNYCGCMYALKKQRDEQVKLDDELISPLTNTILPESIEQRLQLYSKRIKLEENGIKYKIIRDKFLNYRILRGYLKQDKIVIPSYIMPYSTTKRVITKFKLSFCEKDIYYMNRDEIKLISLTKYNKEAKTTYKSLLELIYNPLEFDLDIEIKERILKSKNSLSTLIVVDSIDDVKYELYLNSKIYEDVKENLVIFR